MEEATATAVRAAVALPYIIKNRLCSKTCRIDKVLEFGDKWKEVSWIPPTENS